MSRHWKEEDFLHRLYEIGPEDGHLEACAECRLRFEDWQARRQAMTRLPEAPAEVLAAQRARIMSRIERWENKRAAMVKWSLALAMATAGLAVLLWRAPAPWNGPKDAPRLQTASSSATSDAQLMADIYQSVFASEPAAVAPLHGLFESRQ